MDSARRDVAWPALSPDLSPNDCIFVWFAARFKVHRLCNLVLSQPIPTDVSSHSMSDSRDKPRLTRHHPIHAQNFTIRSRSTAQVPCLFLASTCSDVSSRPPCFEIFVPDVSTRPTRSFFQKLSRRNNATPRLCFVA